MIFIYQVRCFSFNTSKKQVFFVKKLKSFFSELNFVFIYQNRCFSFNRSYTTGMKEFGESLEAVFFIRR
jgi:hypothetical protein